MSINLWKTIGIPLVVAARLILPFFLWKNPLLVWGLIFLVDWFDGDIFRQAFRYQKNSAYQLFDKTMDLYGYCFALALSYTSQSLIFGILLFLFLLRATGMVIFLIKREKKTLALFPNIFENIFIVYILTLSFPSLNFLLEGNTLYITLLVLSAATIARECFLHIKEIQLHEILTGRRWV